MSEREPETETDTEGERTEVAPKGKHETSFLRELSL